MREASCSSVCAIAMRFAAVVARLDGERALADGGNHDVDRDELGNAIRPAEAAQAGGGENDGVVLPFVQLADPRV